MKKRYFFFALSLLASNAIAQTEPAQIQPRIVGGVDAQRYVWSSMLALVEKGKSTLEGQYCGATLIKPNWVITAAHCTEGIAKNWIRVFARVYDLRLDKGQSVNVKRIIRHPLYDPYNLKYDVALLQLEKPLTGIAKPMPLIEGNDTLEGQMATVIGWGNISATNIEYPDRLQEVQLPIISNEECAYAFQTDTTITKAMLCAGYVEGGKDACYGDSGGPLMVWQKGAYHLAGIVSYGEGCAQPLYYGVYTRISAVKTFINKHINPVINKTSHLSHTIH